MNYDYYTADVFTEHAFHGIPLPVFPNAEGLSTEKMQQIAGELSTYSTVFLSSNEDESSYDIRVFSKEKELAIGTHTILAASFILCKIKAIKQTEQHTEVCLKSSLKDHEQVVKSYVSKNSDGSPSLVQQTNNTHAAIDFYTPTKQELAAMLSLTPADIGFDKYKPLIVSCGIPYLIVPIKSYSAIREAKFNESAWTNSSAPSSLAQEILLFANNTDDNPADFHARLLGPSISHNEDPPIGSAIPAFANHICNHPHVQPGTHVFAIQRGANDARQSMFYIEMDNQQSKDLTIRVGGHAVLMSKASIDVR